MLLKAVLAFVIAAIVMAILVPQMHARGVTLRGWMVWMVIASSFAIAVVPSVWRRWKTRRG